MLVYYLIQLPLHFHSFSQSPGALALSPARSLGQGTPGSGGRRASMGQQGLGGGGVMLPEDPFINAR